MGLQNYKNRMALFAVICTTIFAVTGCDFAKEQKYPDGNEELIAFCKKDAGMIVNQKVEVDGYFDDYENGNTAWIDLIKYNLEFVELSMNQEKIDLHGVMLTDRSMFPEYWGKQLQVYTEPGYWRVSRAVLGSEECNPIIQEQITQWRGLGEKMDAYKQHGCFKVEKIDELKSRYGFYDGHETVMFDPVTKMKILRFEKTVRDLADGSILASRVNYTRWLFVKGGMFGTAFPVRTKDCPDIGASKNIRFKGDILSGNVK